MQTPWKLLQNKEAVCDGLISPIHIKLHPTNRCNATCPYCSFAKRERNDELPTEEMLDLVRHFHGLGTRAITLAGGGEPTLHPGFDALLDLCHDLDIQVGIITNGLLWCKKSQKLAANGKLVWARMSILLSDSGVSNVDNLETFAENLSESAVSFYLVITSGVSLKTVERIARTAEELLNVNHVKLCEDGMGKAPEKIADVERLLAGGGYPKTLLQKIDDLPPGREKCCISLLRPVVGADGYVYPCCSVRTRENPEYLLPPISRMAYWRDYDGNTPPFNGGICADCIWDGYNEALAGLTRPYIHGRFV